VGHIFDLRGSFFDPILGERPFYQLELDNASRTGIGGRDLERVKFHIRQGQ
jgi:hypothetical protein